MGAVAPRPLSELLRAAGVRPLDDVAADPTITGVSLDSRRILPGNTFLALSGFRIDGAVYVPDAVGRGASAVVSSSPRPSSLDGGIAWVRVENPRRASGLLAREWYGRPDETLALVGITGTNGKTTVSYLVESIAAASGIRPGRIGTVGFAHGGVERPATRTTPEAPDLFALLAEMRDAGVALVALEVSSHALALGRVEGARFAVAAFLNLGQDHLDFHGDSEAYFEAKARMFETLGPDQAAVLPADDSRGAVLAGRTRARLSTFGRSERASVRLRDEACDLTGSSAVVEIGATRIAVRTRLVGRFNLDNVAAAAACALAAGLPAAAVAPGIGAVDSIPGRMERVAAGQPFTVIVDFAHTEQALARLLDDVRSMIGGRTLLVFGCGGERDRGKRPAMGRAAAERADLVFLTSDNPRSEDPAAILREIEAGIAAVPGGPARCRTVPSRPEAVAAAVSSARPGDAVLIAGKGHESTQTFGDHVVHLDDREVARDALAACGWGGGSRAGA
jgi:UDP-N-acetylmuramoyl-L-alanyl-D-glutamate--2,6-diaminopimelate ligase